jgi:mono/diheme cytochrome c family protein
VFSAAACGFNPVPPEASGGGTTGGEQAETSAGTESVGEGSEGEGSSGAPWEPPPGPWDEGWAIPGFEQIPGDPDAGWWALLNEGYVSCGIPYTLFETVRPLLGEHGSGETLPGREGPNANVPYDWTVHTSKNGVDIASPNCLECHAGRWNGELVIGLGKADADFTEPLGATLAGYDVPDLAIPGIEELQKFVERAAVMAPYARMETVGSNPADMFGVVLASHREPETLEWLAEPHTALPQIPLPIDTPPWWRVKKKHGLFYNGMARGDHRGTMMFASSLCTDTVGEMHEILAYFNNVNAFIRSLEAPKYPFAIDEELAASGEVVFLANCAGCHGTYGETDADDTYPNLLFPLDVVGTDPLMSRASSELPTLADWWDASPYGSTTEIAPNEPWPGYVAPPLDGIWATAPFLHNGSVPTLELVLDSSRRPTYWRRVDYESTNFDEERMGWPYVELPDKPADMPAEDAKHVYDATLLGHWNTGHEFGDHLESSQRRAVIEYLKTI